MSIKGRVTRIEDYLRRKAALESYNLVDMYLEIKQCLKQGDEETLKRYPGEIVRFLRERRK